MNGNNPREKIAILLTSKPNFDEYAFKYFILSLNTIQSTFEFVFPEIEEYYYSKDSYSFNSLFSGFKKVRRKTEFEGKTSYFINIITSEIEDDYYVFCDSNIAFVTTNLWEKYYSPPSLFEYVLNMIVVSILNMHPTLNLPPHMETRGCALDFVADKPNACVDISLGYLCDECKKEIIDKSGFCFLTDIQTMLSGDWIGNIESFDSVAYNLKRFFKFDINKDSGFNKSFWEKAKESFPEIPKELIVGLLSAIIGAVVALVIAK
jgi:hypothetical protein